ncbi:Metallo-dependent hydrolase [Glarea lozoyensis ATCC 20868]|uniref:Dipeptidase n=1 Tax=Glarea lozoyensis (strain ATCC 20868 / MF5171) TaxID=1116229 RepID=S3DFP9_GLAL2|nr:Metallo-dependent hydrolase [Glarea lozoyensis ATCC 20868]EPE30771.1 Metallo-dependent hydrolase [Glarea lozoyensis ATCC 20868]
MPDSPKTHLTQANEILERVPLIDGHNDWPNFVYGYYSNKLDHRFEEQKDLAGHVDIKRLRKGKCGGVFWSAYVDCPSRENDFGDANHHEAIRETYQQIDLIHRLVELYSHSLELVSRASDIVDIFKRGKIASMIGVEGLHQIGNQASNLRNYHRLGVKYVTLTHNSHNLYADCAIKTSVHDGLSEEGKRMILEMNRVGLLIDLSHASDLVALQTMEITKAPVAFTHSSCAALVPHPRCANDASLEQLKENRGIIMISFIPAHNNCDPSSASISDVVDHILHVADQIGFDHIGIGSDFDGMERSVKGLEDVSKFPDLVACMLQRGIDHENIELILCWNIVRVLKEVEYSAARLASEPVLEDEVKSLWNMEFKNMVGSLFPGTEN